MLLLASAAKSKSIAQLPVSTSHSSNVDEPQRLIQTALEFDVRVIASTAQSSTMKRCSVDGVRRSTVSSVLRVYDTTQYDMTKIIDIKNNIEIKISKTCKNVTQIVTKAFVNVA